MGDFLNTGLSWAIYVGRQSDDDYDLAAVMPASERYVTCPASAGDFREETLAYHLAHELTAILQYDGADAILISGDTEAFADVLVDAGAGPPQLGLRAFSSLRRRNGYHVN